MFKKILNKLNDNISIYKNDLKLKGPYWSTIHRLYRFPTLRKALSPLVNFLKPEFIMIDNHKLYIDKLDNVVSQELIQSNKWEKLQTSIFKQNIKKGNIVVDVGAHIGYYTLIAADIVGKKGKVYAFEPDLKNFNILMRNIKVNKYRNIIPINKAVAKKDGKLNLFINPTNSGDHRVYESNKNRKRTEIESVSLDSVLKNEKVDLIKIDIQGSEINALKGAFHTLNNNKALKMIIEFWPGGLKLSGGSQEEFIRLLRNSKFTLYNIDEIKNKVMPISNKKLLSEYKKNEDAFTNLLCLR
jgi:FkbM family methyltransferase